MKKILVLAALAALAACTKEVPAPAASESAVELTSADSATIESATSAAK